MEDWEFMTRPCPPVKIGDIFRYNSKKCEVIKLHKSAFTYKYCNPKYQDKTIKLITYVYWQNNITHSLLGGFLLK